MAIDNIRETIFLKKKNRILFFENWLILVNIPNGSNM